MRHSLVIVAFAATALLAPLPAASAGAGKIASRSSPSRVGTVLLGIVVLGSGSSARMRREETETVVPPRDIDLPPPPLVDAQGVARYVDGDTRTFEIGAPGRRVPVRWTQSTAFSGTGPRSLEGAPVRVQGHMAEGILHATAVERL